MSVNIHLSVYIEKLASPDEADAVEAAVQRVLEEHGIESWMYVGAFHNPPWVKVCTEHGPMIIRGFAEWSPGFERDFTGAVRAIAPAADIDLEWGFPDER
ncbi:hypothetical protein ABZ319_37545 [Nocardia sp. NPDC005978]|uniref:hypothetical protein n=1 Tax=Nocardia sp. NPDC005978 TaxID=3156725 RepID=UPI0033B26CFB